MCRLGADEKGCTGQQDNYPTIHVRVIPLHGYWFDPPGYRVLYRWTYKSILLSTIVDTRQRPIREKEIRTTTM